MAGFPEFLVAWAKTQADLAALLGGTASLRVSPWQSVRKDGTPRVTYVQITGDTVNHLGGATETRVDQWQVDCWGATAAVSREVADLFFGTPSGQRLNGYLGTLAGVKVKSCFLRNRRESPETSMPGTDAGVSCVSFDCDVAWCLA